MLNNVHMARVNKALETKIDELYKRTLEAEAKQKQQGHATTHLLSLPMSSNDSDIDDDVDSNNKDDLESYFLYGKPKKRW